MFPAYQPPAKFHTRYAKQTAGKYRPSRARRLETLRATGIVRRIDELGRVVIPKEIRRTLRIREGDPLQTTSTVSPTERGYIALCGLANLLNQR